MKCPKCGRLGCVPKETNALGVEIQEYSDESGWVGVGKPFESYCAALQALARIPKDGTRRRPYTKLKEPDMAL